MSTTTTRQHQDTGVDTRLVLSALWTAMLFVFAYVDIFGLYRADVLDAALDGRMATTTFTIDQAFLTLCLVYILPAVLMVALSPLLAPRAGRVANIAVSGFYAVTIVLTMIGEQWAYYLLGSAVELVLLGAVVRVAWTWRPSRPAPPELP